MNPRPSLYLCAVALAGCPGGDSDSSPTGSSGGLTGSTTETAGGTTTGDPTMSTGTGTTEHVLTTSTGEEPTTGPVATTGTTGTTGDTGGEPAPDWALIDVNPASATYEQTRARSDYAGLVSGWYFAHAT